MVRYENECVECGMPCIDCGRKRVPHYYCDKCKEEKVLYIFDWNGWGSMELCATCLLEEFSKVEGSY